MASKNVSGDINGSDDPNKENTDSKQDKEIEEDEPELIENEVTLSWYDSDLNLSIEKPGLCAAKPICEGRFARIWAGARATHGYTMGRVCYQVKVADLLDVSDCIYIKRELQPHLIRIGWSTFEASLQLGEDPRSYGFDSSGKSFVNCKNISYGKLFNKKNDIVTAYLDFTGQNISISYDLNGTSLGEAFSIPKEELCGQALAPHVFTKNIRFEVNFGQTAPWGQIQPGYQFVGNIPLDFRTRGPRAPPSREACEVILVCGLPAAGKTTWATNHAKENPSMRYTTISINALSDKMKVNGVPRKLKTDVYEGPNVKCLEKLMHIACHRRRNFILDQTSWKRKIRNFENYNQICVVVQPTVEEYRRRVNKQITEGERYVSDSDTFDVTSKYTLPDPSLFQQVIYTELGPGELEKAMSIITAEAKEKFSKILADAKTNNVKKPVGPTGKQKQNSPRGYNNNLKRMRGSYGGNDGYSFSNYSTSYPLKRPMPGFQNGGAWRPVVVPTASRSSYGGSMVGGVGLGAGLLGMGPGGRVPPRGYMSPSTGFGRNGPSFGSGPQPRGRGGVQNSRIPPIPPMPREFRGPNSWNGDFSGDFYMDGDSNDRSDWGRWWQAEGRKMYGRWLASNY